ncbi:MAG TPA: hypothetical protein VN649_01640 [Ramlibacter sp.]|nr:hypothetical protein [Ramlibacter sp.]
MRPNPFSIAGPVTLVLLLVACSESPPSWQKLLAGKISEQYPTYQVQPTAGGGLMVQRPGRPAIAVDVEAIARFCQRGPRDCNYATDQMLLELRR